MLLHFTYHHGRFFHLSTGINGLPSQPETPQDFPMIFSWTNPANPLKKGSPFASEHVEIHRKLNVLGMDSSYHKLPLTEMNASDWGNQYP